MIDHPTERTSPTTRPVGQRARRLSVLLLAATVACSGTAVAEGVRKRPCYIPERLDDPGCPIEWPKGGGKSGSPGNEVTPSATRTGEPRSRTEPRDEAEPTASGGVSATVKDGDGLRLSGPSLGTAWSTVERPGRKRGKTRVEIETVMASIGLSKEAVGKMTFTPVASGTVTAKTDVAIDSVKIDLLTASLGTSGRFAGAKSGLSTQIGRLLSGDPDKVEGGVDLVAVEAEKRRVAATYRYQNGPFEARATLGDVGSSGRVAVGFDEKGRPRVAVGGEIHAVAAAGEVSYTHPFRVGDIDVRGRLAIGATALDGEVKGAFEASSKKVGASVSGHVDLVTVSARPSMEVFGYEIGFEAMVGLGAAFEASVGFGKGFRTKADADVDFGVRKGLDFVFRRAEDDEPEKPTRVETGGVLP